MVIERKYTVTFQGNFDMLNSSFWSIVGVFTVAKEEE